MAYLPAAIMNTHRSMASHLHDAYIVNLHPPREKKERINQPIAKTRNILNVDVQFIKCLAI
jgi:hypothetical protein